MISIEEVKRAAEELFCLPNYDDRLFHLTPRELQAFAQHYIEVGRKMQRESDAKLCETHTYATGPMNEHGNTRYLIPFNNDFAGGLHHSGITYAEAIRNNTGE